MRFRFNEKKAAQAAAHLLKLSGGTLNDMVLIKLLFLADRATLLKHGQPITGARMVSLKNGPVLSEVLNLIDEGSREPGPWVAYMTPPSEYDVKLKVAEPETDELSRYELRVLGEVFKEHGKKNKWVLVKWLHDHIPEWTDPDGGALEIDYDDVLRVNGILEPQIEDVHEGAKLLWALNSLGR